MLTKNNRVWAAVALLTAAIGFTSCLKNDKVTPSRPTAQIFFLNASTSPVAASFYDNGQKIGNDTLSINFNFVSRYQPYGGTHTFELKKKGGDSLITTSTYTYDSVAYYTYVILGKNPVQSVSVKSDFTSADQNKINIRCLNLSAGGAGDLVDFYVGNEKIDSGRAPMSISAVAYATKFTQFSNFSVNNTVTIKKAGTNEVLATNNTLTTLYNLGMGRALNVGGVYTIYFAGTPSVTSGYDKPLVDVIPSYY